MREIDGEILKILEREGLTVAFIARFPGGRNFDVKRQLIGRNLRRINGNKRKHYGMIR